MTSAERFLRQFADASARAKALEAIGSDPDGFSEAVVSATDAFTRALEADAEMAPAGPALINPEVFASAACDSDGVVIAADARFNDWLATSSAVHVDVSPLADGRGASVSFLVEDHGKFIAVAAARLAGARGWPLADDVRACLESGRAEIAVIARLPVRVSSAYSRAARVLGLTGLEARVVAGLIEHGNAREAAEAAGVTYETARATLKDAMRKAGVKRQSALVSICMEIESGEAPAAQVAPVLQDLFSLTERQADIALQLARGLSRAEAAAALRISENVVKAELKVLFAACLVDSVSGLCRVVGQLSALSALAGAVAVDFHATASVSEPLRLLPRSEGGGRIAFADHGPASASAMLFLHSGTTGRHLPPRYIAQLQQLGLRPIVLDRPGYGLTSMPEGDFLDASADDLVRIADHLKLERAHVVCRSGAVVVARFAQRHSRRLARAVLINPEPPNSHDSRFTGFLGGLKRMIAAQPGALEALVRTLSRRAAPLSILGVVRSAVRQSPADLALLDDPEFAEAFVRASQQAAMQEGRGFVALERCVAANALAAGDVPGDERFHILCGADDSLQATEDALNWWRETLPNASYEVVAGGGRFVHAQRPELIAAALLQNST